jgi:hypothetical protein
MEAVIDAVSVTVGEAVQVKVAVSAGVHISPEARIKSSTLALPAAADAEETAMPNNTSAGITMGSPS